MILKLKSVVSSKQFSLKFLKLTFNFLFETWFRSLGCRYVLEAYDSEFTTRYKDNLIVFISTFNVHAISIRYSRACAMGIFSIDETTANYLFLELCTSCLLENQADSPPGCEYKTNDIPHYIN